MTGPSGSDTPVTRPAVRRARLAEAAGKDPARVARLGPEGVLVSGAGRQKTALLDGALALQTTLALRAHGQIAGSADGRLVAASTLRGATVTGLDGKAICKVEHADWWEENSGGVAFVDGGRRLLYVCLPDEEELDARLAVGLVDLTRPKAKPALVAVDFDLEAHHRLALLPDGSAVLWSNAQQDAQAYFHVTIGPEGPVVTPLALDMHAVFLGHVTPDGALLVSDRRAVVWMDGATGAERKRIELAHVLVQDDEILAAVPLGGDRLLLHLLSFPSRTRALVEVGGAASRVVEIEGTAAGTVTALTTDARGCPLAVFEDGTVLTLGAGPG